uniref:Uncharacterized protein n=1 Tax=Hyaloperonospora arabidopsidis (strain Emoy2) TaxID=559515 RepID=M4B323_HYAAE
MGDFPPKERGPVSWLPGGARLCPLLQLAADWEVGSATKKKSAIVTLRSRRSAASFSARLSQPPVDFRWTGRGYYRMIPNRVRRSNKASTRGFPSTIRMNSRRDCVHQLPELRPEVDQVVLKA